MPTARVVQRFRLNGTIDKHDPIGVTLRIKKDNGDFFRVTFITVNLGRGYASTRQFKNNVWRVLNKVGEREYVIILFQELDEADAAREKVIVAGMMEPGTTLVRWETREPIAVSPGVPVRRKRAVTIMEQGTVIGGPQGTGPRRKFVTCVVTIEGVIFGVGNQHPHRYSITHPKVQEARKSGEQITERELGEMVEICHFVVWGGDLNTVRYPKMHPKERILYRVNYDQLRLIKGNHG